MPSEIALRRLASQSLASPDLSAPQEVVRWMGALQAQDFPMAKWALGARSSGATEKQVEAALDRGEILRTHLLRPTWHIVPAEDIYWMLELTAPVIKSGLRSRHKQLGLDSDIITKAVRTIEKALGGGDHLTREELVSALVLEKIDTGDNRASHYFMLAELAGVICSGSARNGKTTYALLETRVPKPASISKDEALEKLAKRYFSSRGPATLQDFTWWSGLSAGDGRRALEIAKLDFDSEIVGSQEYWFSRQASTPVRRSSPVHLLPAYDEYLISYTDRSASLALATQPKTISNNGIFRPTVVIEGVIWGTWKRTVKKELVLIEIDLFKKPAPEAAKLIAEAAANYGEFLEKQVALQHTGFD